MTNPNRPNPNRLFIFVEGGAVTEVLDAAGEIAGFAAVIDYDNERDGHCPVCREELEIVDAEEKIHGKLIGGKFVCPACGYDERSGNALECSVKLHAEDDKFVKEATDE